ncbi:MAG: hypothetical protein GC168_08895 [Candidatus Hydrogenedens sp.]|nr:hypothetical protein [Candidatus Hydrogenedens sp.]
MPGRKPTAGFVLLEHCVGEGRRVMDGWTVLQQILGAYSQPGANKAALEAHFLKVKSELARAISSLSGRMSGDCYYAIPAMNFLAGCTSLEQVYSQSEVAIKKMQGEWHRTFMAMNELAGEMEELHRRALAHERVRFAGREVYVPPPFPWRKVLAVGGVAAAVVLLGGGSLFARYFLGVGAPAAGVGMEMDPSLSDEDQVYLLLSRLKRAFENRDLDLLMSAFADDFRDVEGRNKTALRAMLQTVMSTIGTDSVSLDTRNARVSISDGTGFVGPIGIQAPQLSLAIMVRGKKVDGVWLISYIDEAK